MQWVTESSAKETIMSLIRTAGYLAHFLSRCMYITIKRYSPVTDPILSISVCGPRTREGCRRSFWLGVWTYLVAIAAGRCGWGGNKHDNFGGFERGKRNR